MTRPSDDIVAWLRRNPGRVFDTSDMVTAVRPGSRAFRNHATRRLTQLSKFGFCERVPSVVGLVNGGADAFLWRSCE